MLQASHTHTHTHKHIHNACGIHMYVLWWEEQTTDTVGVTSGLGEVFNSTEIIKKCPKGKGVLNKQGI